MEIVNQVKKKMCWSAECSLSFLLSLGHRVVLRSDSLYDSSSAGFLFSSPFESFSGSMFWALRRFQIFRQAFENNPNKQQVLHIVVRLVWTYITMVTAGFLGPKGGRRRQECDDTSIIPAPFWSRKIDAPGCDAAFTSPRKSDFGAGNNLT